MTSSPTGRGQRHRDPAPLVRPRSGSAGVGSRSARPAVHPLRRRDAGESAPTAPGVNNRGSGYPVPTGTTTGTTSSRRSTAGACRRLGGRELRRPRVVVRPRRSVRWERHRSPISSPCGPGSWSTRWHPVGRRTLSSGRWWSTSGRSTPARPTCRLPAGSRTDGPMHVGYLLDPDGHVSTVHGVQGTNLSFSYIERTGLRRFGPSPSWDSAISRSTTPVSTSGTQITAMARHAAMPNVPAPPSHPRFPC